MKFRNALGAIFAISLLSALPATAQLKHDIVAKTATYTGATVATPGVCASVTVWSASTSVGTVLFEQSLDGTTWFTVDTFTNPSLAAPQTSGPLYAPFSRLRISAYTSGTISGDVGWAPCNTATDTQIAMGANGAVKVQKSTVYFTKAGVLAATLAAPTSEQNGMIIRFVATTAQANTITCPAGKLGGSAVATFGGAANDGITLIAFQGIWRILSRTNITLS